MNRNQESHFSQLPRVSIGRSRFDRDSRVVTTFNVGDLVPLRVDEVLPGDTFSVKSNKVVRLQTMLTPMMDNLYLDTYWFFVPNRLVWEHWQNFMGENTASAWAPSTTYTIPQLTAPSGGWNVGTIADYMGIPTGVDDISVSALPFRAYALIMDQWFRDENLSSPLSINKGDSTVVGVNSGNYITDTAKGGAPFKASKYHDYFTSALPAPQKGPDVTLPIGAKDEMPVYALNKRVPDGDDYRNLYPIMFETKWPGSSAFGQHGWVPNMSTGVDTSNYIKQTSGHAGDLTDLTKFDSSSLGSSPLNLWAVGDGSVSTATINQLRMAFQTQHMLEKDARGGTRYTEILQSHFGVTSPDARLQRAEYLGGNRVPLNVSQIVQQSETGSTPQGTPVGLSLTTDSHGDFSKSFTEHGYLMCVGVVRYSHTYQQGIPRHFSRLTRYDFYDPIFANIGEQGIKNKELFAQGSAQVNPTTGVAYDEEIFGYQEAWAEYRYANNIVTGEMRSQYATSLDVWHLADEYASMPYLSDSWIREDKSNVDRVLAVTSSVSNQVLLDDYIQCRCIRPMPVYSIPGMMDHH